jgi:hypothetical protein
MNTQAEKPLTRHQLYRMAHREQLAEKARKWRAENPGVWNARTLASRHKKWDEYLAKNNERNRKLRADMKAKAIAALGERCASCGYDTDVRALQIDHINGDGYIERKAQTSQHAFYRDIAAHGSQGRYQVLCANCNQIKRMEAKEHPTGKPRTKGY